MSGLAGVRVVVTRAQPQASALAAALRAVGAIPIEIPTIEIADPSDGGAALAAAVSQVESYDWVVFTSANAVDRFLRIGPPKAARIAVVGTATRAALEQAGHSVDLIPSDPSDFVADALVEAFDEGPGRVLYPSAAAGRPTIVDGLTKKGWNVHRVEAYRTGFATVSEAAREELEQAEVVTFASGSSVDRYCELFGADQIPPVIACIGPVTAAAVTAHGIEPTIAAVDHTVDGLVRALVDLWECRQS
ncbi:MAG: uroporphyrinogen-III synthase [Acidimicrobiales bacterium]